MRPGAFLSRLGGWRAMYLRLLLPTLVYASILLLSQVIGLDKGEGNSVAAWVFFFLSWMAGSAWPLRLFSRIHSAFVAEGLTTPGLRDAAKASLWLLVPVPAAVSLALFAFLATEEVPVPIGALFSAAAGLTLYWGAALYREFGHRGKRMRGAETRAERAWLYVVLPAILWFLLPALVSSVLYRPSAGPRWLSDSLLRLFVPGTFPSGERDYTSIAIAWCMVIAWWTGWIPIAVQFKRQLQLFRSETVAGKGFRSLAINSLWFLAGFLAFWQFARWVWGPLERAVIWDTFLRPTNPRDWTPPKIEWSQNQKIILARTVEAVLLSQCLWVGVVLYHFFGHKWARARRRLLRSVEERREDAAREEREKRESAERKAREDARLYSMQLPPLKEMALDDRFVELREAFLEALKAERVGPRGRRPLPAGALDAELARLKERVVRAAEDLIDYTATEVSADDAQQVLALTRLCGDLHDAGYVGTAKEAYTTTMALVDRMGRGWTRSMLRLKVLQNLSACQHLRTRVTSHAQAAQAETTELFRLHDGDYQCMDTPFRNLLSYMKDTSEDDIAPFMKKPPRSAFSALQSVVNPRRSQ